MREQLPEILERHRLVRGVLATDRGFHANGAFMVKGPKQVWLKIVASNGILHSAGHDETKDWEHVSVSTKVRCPTWDEMCFVKDLFWMPEETVIQIHPPASEHVNNHLYCLHMWRHRTQEFLRPPAIMVGNAALGENISKGQAIAAVLQQQRGAI